MDDFIDDAEIEIGTPGQKKNMGLALWAAELWNRVLRCIQSFTKPTRMRISAGASRTTFETARIVSRIPLKPRQPIWWLVTQYDYLWFVRKVSNNWLSVSTVGKGIVEIVDGIAKMKRPWTNWELHYALLSASKMFLGQCWQRLCRHRHILVVHDSAGSV